MAFKEFPGIVIGDKPTVSRYWDQEAVSPVYSAGNMPYARLFRESIERIPREYPDVKGIGWDSCFASRSIPETHIGFAGTPRKSFRRGVPFVHESVGLAELLDFNHTHFTGPHRMANAVNYKLTAPYSIASRTDAALYEGAPMVRPEFLWRMEAHRARLGSHKLMSWHGGCDKKRMAWAGFDKMSPEDADDAHRQLLDDVLFLSYDWGVAPVPDLTLENGERLVGAMCELLELITSGWHTSPACDAPEGVLVARYGEGASARIAAINPGYEALDAELSLPEDYWPQFKGGKKLKVSIPARQVMIVNPVTGRSRPAATRPPVAVKKPFGIGLMRWMGRSGLLAR